MDTHTIMYIKFIIRLYLSENPQLVRQLLDQLRAGRGQPNLILPDNNGALVPLDGDDHGDRDNEEAA